MRGLIFPIILAVSGPLALSGEFAGKMALAREVAELTNRSSVDAEEAATDTREQMRAAFRWDELDPAGRRKLDAAIETVAATFPDEVSKTTARAYASTFTTEELRGMRTFFKSEAGKAYLEKQARLNAKLTLMSRLAAENAHKRLATLRRQNEGRGE